MKLSIIGSGVIGQATGFGFLKKGHDVVFYDIDEEKLSILKDRGKKVTWSILSAVKNSDVIFVCVPTPTIDGSMVFDIIQKVLVDIGQALNVIRKYRVVVIRSTVLPSTTRCKVVPLLEKFSKLSAGEDFGVCINPEFLRDRSALQDFLNPNKIVIGEFDKKSGDWLEKVYSSFGAPIIRTDFNSAEMIKYTSNLFLATKISFFNEMYIFCQELGVDSEILGKVVSLDPRISEYGVYGGQCFDGKCLPKDLEAFRSFVRSFGHNPKLLDAVSFVNEEIKDLKPKKVVTKY